MRQVRALLRGCLLQAAACYIRARAGDVNRIRARGYYYRAKGYYYRARGYYYRLSILPSTVSSCSSVHPSTTSGSIYQAAASIPVHPSTTSGRALPFAVSDGLWVAAFGTLGCGLWVAAFGLRSLGCGLWVAAFGLRPLGVQTQ